MHGFVLQDFVTIRGSSTTQTVTQSENDWVELGPFEDFVAWIDIREVTLGGATNIQFNLQTAPIKDEFLFVTMESSPLTATAALTGAVRPQDDPGADHEHGRGAHPARTVRAVAARGERGDDDVGLDLPDRVLRERGGRGRRFGAPLTRRRRNARCRGEGGRA
jgi:hypothetical protein